MNSAAAQTWFTDLWNFSIIPYMIEALRDTARVGLIHVQALKFKPAGSHVLHGLLPALSDHD